MAKDISKIETTERKTIPFQIWNDYSCSLIRCVRATYPKNEYRIVRKKKYKRYTTYYLEKK